MALKCTHGIEGVERPCRNHALWVARCLVNPPRGPNAVEGYKEWYAFRACAEHLRNLGRMLRDEYPFNYPYHSRERSVPLPIRRMKADRRLRRHAA